MLLIESHLRKVGCDQTAKQLMKERIWKKEFRPKNNKQDVVFGKIVKRSKSKRPTNSEQDSSKLKMSLSAVLEKHVSREYASNRNHVTTSVPEYRFIKTKPVPKGGGQNQVVL